MGRVSHRSTTHSISTSFPVSSMSKRSRGIRGRGRITILGIRHDAVLIPARVALFILQEYPCSNENEVEPNPHGLHLSFTETLFLIHKDNRYE
jgi:hypothetical protein